MALFKRSKKEASTANVGVTYWNLKEPGILSGTGYHSLSEAPEVAAAIGIIADLISTMPLHLMENRDNGDVRIKDALWRKIDINPYSLGTRQTLMHWIVETMMTDGESVVIPKTAGFQIADLIPAPGASLYRYPGEESYKCLYRGYELDAGDILHFRLRPDPLYPWRGVGLAIPLERVVNSIVTTAETKTAYMSSEYKPPIIVAVNSDSPLSDEKERERFAQKFLKRKDPALPWIVPADLMTVSQIKPLSLTDLAIKDGVELDKRTVSAITGVPGFLLGVGAFSKDEYNLFISRKILPIARGIEMELTKKLLMADNRYWRFNPRGLYSYSLTELSTIARANRDGGLMTGNEARNWIDMPPMPGLDELVMLENYIPADRLGDQSKLNEPQPKEEESNA